MRRVANAQLMRETLDDFHASLQSSRSKGRPTKPVAPPATSSGSPVPIPGEIDPSVRAAILSVPPDQMRLILTRSPPPFVDTLCGVRAARDQQRHRNELYKEKAKVLAGQVAVEVRKRKQPEDWLSRQTPSEPSLTPSRETAQPKPTDIWAHARTKRSRPTEGERRPSAPQPRTPGPSQTQASSSASSITTVIDSSLPGPTRQTPFGYAARQRTKKHELAASVGGSPIVRQSGSKPVKAKKSTLDSYFGRT